MDKHLTYQSMLEHQKMVLRAVSDNEELFKKEMIKALTWLKPREKRIFRKWLRENYLKLYPDLIEISEMQGGEIAS